MAVVLKKQRPVAKGETLSLIAAQEGVSVDDIIRANNMTGDTILVGQRLKIPDTTVKPQVPATVPTYTIAPQRPTVQKSNLVGLRDTATGLGYDVTAQGATPFVSGKQIDTTGLQNIGGRWMGTPDVVKQKIQSVTATPSRNLVYDENTDSMVDTNTGDVVQRNVKRGQVSSDVMSYEDIQRIMNDIAAKYQPTVQTITMDEATERAKTLLNPQYEQAGKDIETRLQLGGVMSGFGGQPVGTAALADALTKNAYQKAQAISQTAEQLYGQSKSEAAAAEAAAAQQRQQEIANMLNALTLSQQSQAANRSYALEAQKFMSSEEQRQFENDILDRKTKIDEAAMQLDQKIKEGQLTIQQAQVLLEQKKIEDDKEMAGKELSLREKQLKSDSDARAAQISADWARIGLQQSQFAWEKDPTNPQNLLAMQKLTSQPDYNYQEDPNWLAAYSMAIDPKQKDELYNALIDPISQKKFQALYGYKGFNALYNLVKPKTNPYADIMKSFGLTP